MNSIATQVDLGIYYRKFIVIMKWLIDKGRFREIEVSQLFMAGLPGILQNQIQMQLSILHPNHMADKHYPMEEIYWIGTHTVHMVAYVHITNYIHIE